MFVPSESLYTQGNRSRSTNALLLIALKVASGPSFLNFSCTRRTIAMASSRVPNSAADTESTDVATNEAPKSKAARRMGARRIGSSLEVGSPGLAVQWTSVKGLISISRQKGRFAPLSGQCGVNWVAPWARRYCAHLLVPAGDARADDRYRCSCRSTGREGGRMTPLAPLLTG